MGLIEALRDPQFGRDVKQGILDAANRGAVAGTIGAPVDLVTLAMRPFGYAEKSPIGGSEWIGKKMHEAGMVSENRNPVAESLASVAIPSMGVKMAPHIYAAENAVIQNGTNQGLLGNYGGLLGGRATPRMLGLLASGGGGLAVLENNRKLNRQP